MKGSPTSLQLTRKSAKSSKKELAEQGSRALYRKLQDLDPERAATLDHTKTHRLIRNLEIIELIGKSSKPPSPTPEMQFHAVALNFPREELYQRINLRVEEMMSEGLLQEAEALLKKYRPEISNRTLPALLTVGYQELFDHLERKTHLRGRDPHTTAHPQLRQTPVDLSAQPDAAQLDSSAIDRSGTH